MRHWTGHACNGVKRIRTAFGVLLLSLAVAACGLSERIGKRVEDAWIGDILFSHSDRVKLRFEGADYLNPDGRDRPLSAVVRIYQLRSLDKFRSIGTDQLWDDGAQALAGTLLDMQEITVVPGKVKEGEWPMAEAARYVAVAAFFRNELGARWKVALPADDMRKDGLLFSTDGARLLLEGNTLLVVRGQDSLHPLRPPLTADSTEERRRNPLPEKTQAPLQEGVSHTTKHRTGTVAGRVRQ